MADKLAARQIPFIHGQSVPNQRAVGERRASHQQASEPMSHQTTKLSARGKTVGALRYLCDNVLSVGSWQNCDNNAAQSVSG